MTTSLQGITLNELQNGDTIVLKTAIHRAYLLISPSKKIEVYLHHDWKDDTGKLQRDLVYRRTYQNSEAGFDKATIDLGDVLTGAIEKKTQPSFKDRFVGIRLASEPQGAFNTDVERETLTIVANDEKWIVAENEEGQPRFAAFESADKIFEMLNTWRIVE